MMRMMHVLLLILLAAAAMGLLTCCSRPAKPADTYTCESYRGCQFEPDSIPPEIRPGLAGIRLVPLPAREFRILRGSKVNFVGLRKDNPNLYVEIPYEVNSDGSVSIIDSMVVDRGYPEASITIKDALKGWMYEPECLRMQLTLILSARRGFLFDAVRILDTLPGCSGCGVQIKNELLHRVIK